MPPALRIVFLENNNDVVQSYLLPPLLQPESLHSTSGIARAMAEWHLHFHTGSQACLCTGGTQTITIFMK